jgi:SAM-dependent methyltransferase
MKRMSRHLATQQQGDWTAVAARDYASHRQTFQADYARDCWRRLSQRAAVAPVVARAARVLDVGCGSGEFTRELASHLPRASIVGVDISEGMVRHAERANAHERVQYAVVDLADDDGPLLQRLAAGDADGGAKLAEATKERDEGSLRFQVATSTMALHWPGPDPSFLSGVRHLIEPGGVFLAGLHGAGSCQEGVDAFEKVAGLDLEGLPTMFKRSSAAAWERALCDAGFVDVEVEERTVATRYASAADCQRRLAAAWPPILSGHVPAAEIDKLVAAAARAMIDGTGLMTSRLLEFSCSVVE